MLPLLFACQREQKAGGNLPDEDGLVQVEFSFKTEKPRTIAVRATEAVPDGEGGIQMTVTTDNAPATREGNLTSDEEDAIENVWALQFDGNGKFIRRELVPYPEPIYGEPEMRYRLKVRLYIQDNCTVYFVANRPDINWQSSLIAGTTTLDEFKEMTLNMYSEDEVIKDNLIPMAGHYEGPVPNTSGTVVDMTRMAAKIVFTLNYLLTQTDNSTLGITSVQLVNVPVLASYYNGAEVDPDWKYPDISDPNMIYNLTDYTAITNSAGFETNTDHTFTWYVPENRRGINPTVTRQEDKWKGNDPSIADGGYSAATRIVMKGWIVKYTVNVNSFSDPGIVTPQSDDPIGGGENPGGGPTDPGGNPGRPPLGAKDIVINLHPGRNNTTDYNVIRNSTYNIRASIRSIKEEPRVEAGPMVMYRYYYEDPAEDGKLIFLDADYTTALAVGETIPKDDPIPNAKKNLIPANGQTYRDGIVADYPTTVSAEDMYNVVNIMYYRERTGPFSVEVTWLKAYTQFDHEIFGPYDKGTIINAFGDYVLGRYGFSIDGYSHSRTEVIGVSTGMEYPPSTDIPLHEDLKISIYYMRYTRSQ